MFVIICTRYEKQNVYWPQLILDIKSVMYVINHVPIPQCAIHAQRQGGPVFSVNSEGICQFTLTRDPGCLLEENDMDQWRVYGALEEKVRDGKRDTGKCPKYNI